MNRRIARKVIKFFSPAALSKRDGRFYFDATYCEACRVLHVNRDASDDAVGQTCAS